MLAELKTYRKFLNSVGRTHLKESVDVVQNWGVEGRNPIKSVAISNQHRDPWQRASIL